MNPSSDSHIDGISDCGVVAAMRLLDGSVEERARDDDDDDDHHHHHRE